MPTPEEIAKYPIHVKNVGELSISKLESLSTSSPDSLNNWNRAKIYLTDPSLYSKHMVPRSANGAPVARMSYDQVKTLKEFGVTREIRACDVAGYVKMFTVPEIHKKRHRPIKYTFEANEVFGKDTLRKLSFPSKKDICDFVLAGSHFAAFDFAAYYDQFIYDEQVGKFFCFRKGKKIYSLRTLAMGQRQAVEIAQSATELILDFPERRCKAVRATIDNVIFVGSYDDVVHDSKIFLERCKQVNATLNDFEEIKRDGPDFYVKTIDDWCGVRIDSEKKQVSLCQKTVDKIMVSWSARKGWTWRGFAAHVGLLFWTWGILDIPIHKYYTLLSFISQVSRILQDDDTLWDKDANIYPSVFKVLEEWSSLAINNSPRKVKPSSDLSWFVATDASSWGWGYVACDMSSGKIYTHGQKWTHHQLAQIFARNGRNKVKKSVYSEPLAIYFSLQHLLYTKAPTKLQINSISTDSSRMKLHVATDNAAAQHTINRGFASRSYDINNAIDKLKSLFPDSEFDISCSYVPGYRNPADLFSRGKESNVSTMKGKQQFYEDLRRLMGDSWIPTREDYPI